MVEVRFFHSRNKLAETRNGFFVGANGNIITLRRPLRAAKRVEIKTSGGKVHAVTGIVAEDTEADIVRLATSAVKPPHHLELNNSLPQDNEKVLVVGIKKLTETRALEVGEMRYLGTIFLVRISPSKEFVGAPVVSTKGNLIGLISSSPRNSQLVVFGSNILSKLTGAPSKPIGEWQASLKPNWDQTEEGLYATGIRLSLSGNYEESLPVFEKTLKVNPNNYKAALRLARAEREIKKHQESLAHYQLALKLKPDSAEAHGGIGLAYESLGRREKAIEAFKLAMALNPLYETPYLRLARIYMSQGRDKEALATLLSLTKIKPDSSDGQVSLGWIYAQTKQFDLAKRAYQRALELNPDSETAHLMLGTFHAEQNDQHLALAHLKKGCGNQAGFKSGVNGIGRLAPRHGEPAGSSEDLSASGSNRNRSSPKAIFVSLDFERRSKS